MLRKDKDIVLFISSAPEEAVKAVRDYGKSIKRKLLAAALKDIKSEKNQNTSGLDLVIYCDLSKSLKITKALLPYQERLLAVTCRGDKNIADFARVIPCVPYLKTATSESLFWAVDKISMRERLKVYDPKITPRFLVISDCTKETINEVKKKVGFPLVIKPASLGASLLVTVCYHQEEFEASLNKIFKKIKTIYKSDHRQEKPQILVEQFMDGEMYSIDAYVSSRGRIYFCPLVHVKTGVTIGFDDFFGYRQMTPTLLKPNSIAAAELVAGKAVKALGLRSVTAHIELMKTEDGFKVIELGPRLGGFRHSLYDLAYGFNHSLNDVLIRIPQKPIIYKKPKGYSAAMKFFAKKEGILKKLNGLKKVQKLASFYHLKVNKKVGERCLFAKNGGRSVFDIILFNPSRSELLADIRRLEQLAVIETAKN